MGGRERGRGQDPSVTAEPHLRPGGAGFTADPGEARAERALRRERGRDDPARADHSVWDEPGLSPELLQPLARRGGQGYARWLGEGVARTRPGRSWAVTALCALAAGPFGVVGALLGGEGSPFALLALVVFGPVAEEVLKVAVPLLLVEQRPYLFRHGAQLLLCGLGGGLLFAGVENLLYLHVYVPDASAELVAWRWSVCVLLHAGCSIIASLGVARVWRDALQRRARPRLQLGLRYTITAAVIHGTYNGAALLLSLSPYGF